MANPEQADVMDYNLFYHSIHVPQNWLIPDSLACPNKKDSSCWPRKQSKEKKKKKMNLYLCPTNELH